MNHINWEREVGELLAFLDDYKVKTVVEYVERRERSRTAVALIRQHILCLGSLYVQQTELTAQLTERIVQLTNEVNKLKAALADAMGEST